MTRFIAQRIGYSVLVVWGAVSMVFVIVRAIPGDSARMYAGPLATAEQVEAARTTLGLDAPLHIQYVDFMRALATLDFGASYRFNQPVMDLFLERLPATVWLALTAMAIGVVLSFPLGILAALFRGRRIDRVVSMLSLIGQSVPNFWLGILGILVFSVALGMLPTGRMTGPASFIMPSIVLAVPLLGVLVRLVRAGLIDVLNEPYIMTARAKGLSVIRILFGHAIKNMLIPVITVMGLQLGQLLSGAVVVEVVFAWPGLGRLLVDAITNRDFPIVQTVILFVAVVFVTINLVTDLLYGWLDPRIRQGAK